MVIRINLMSDTAIVLLFHHSLQVSLDFSDI